MQVVRTVFNGGHEETYGNATRLVPTQRGAYTRHLDSDVHSPGKRHTQKIERKHLDVTDTDQTLGP